MRKWLKVPGFLKSAYDVEAEGRVPEVLDRTPTTIDAADRGSFVTEVNAIKAEHAVAAYCFNPDVYAVVNLKATMTASLPLKIYQVKPNGAKTEITSGRLYDLIENPNPNTTKSQLIEQFCSWYELAGSAYIVLEEILGEFYLICLNSLYVKPVVVKEHGIDGIVYKKGNKLIYYAKEHVLRRTRFNPNDDFYGMTPIQPLADDVQARKSAMKFLKNHYKRGGISGGILKMDGGFDDGELRKLRKDWENRKEDASRLVILPDGWDFTEITGKESGSAPVDVMKLSLAAVCNAFGVPITLLSPDKNTHPTESEIFLWTSQLLPSAKIIGELFTSKFGVSNNRGKIVIEMDKSGIPVLQQFELEATRIRIADLSSGFKTVNEFRAESDMPPISEEKESFGDSARPVWTQANAEKAAQVQAEAQMAAIAAKPTTNISGDPAGRDQSSSGEKPMSVDASGKK